VLAPGAGWIQRVPMIAAAGRDGRATPTTFGTLRLASMHRF
jgi:hypothetical protein